MKRVGWLLFLILSVNVFAEERATYTFRAQVDRDKIVMRDDRIFLSSESLGDITLDNIHFDEKGYYTLCQFSLICSNCHNELYERVMDCSYCGSGDIEFCPLQERTSSYLTVQAVLGAYLSDHSYWKKQALICGRVAAGGEVDDDGNVSGYV